MQHSRGMKLSSLALEKRDTHTSGKYSAFQTSGVPKGKSSQQNDGQRFSVKDERRNNYKVFQESSEGEESCSDYGDDSDLLSRVHNIFGLHYPPLKRIADEDEANEASIDRVSDEADGHGVVVVNADGASQVDDNEDEGRRYRRR